MLAAVAGTTFVAVAFVVEPVAVELQLVLGAERQIVDCYLLKGFGRSATINKSFSLT